MPRRCRPNREGALPIQYFFKFRQTKPSPPGQWITCGPFDTYEQGKAERDKSKAWDAEVGNVFSAASIEEAKKKNDLGF